MASGKLTQVEVADQLEISSVATNVPSSWRRCRGTQAWSKRWFAPPRSPSPLVKFQWSKIAKKLFEVRHKQIELMKVEITAPGREVAYIVKARERFGS
jgi:hypothetical protein